GDRETIDSFELDLSSLPAFSPLNKLMSKPSNKKRQEFICHISLEASINPPGTSRRPAQATAVSAYFPWRPFRWRFASTYKRRPPVRRIPRRLTCPAHGS